MSVEKRVEKLKTAYLVCGIIIVLLGFFGILDGCCVVWMFFGEIRHNMGYVIPSYSAIGKNEYLLINLMKCSSWTFLFSNLIYWIADIFFLCRRKHITSKMCMGMSVLLGISIIGIWFASGVIWCVDDTPLGDIMFGFSILPIVLLLLCIYTKSSLKNVNAKKRIILAIVLLVIVFLLIMLGVKGYYNWLRTS